MFHVLVEKVQKWTGADMPAEDASGNYIRRHWRGELSLLVSFWLNTVLINQIIRHFIGPFIPTMEDSTQPALVLFVLFSITSLTLAITTWQITGTWRSAAKHREKTGRKVWATAAQILMILVILSTVNSYIPNVQRIAEFSKIVTGMDGFSKVKVNLKNNTNVHIDGYITYNLIDEVIEYFKINENIKSIHLNSLGGRIVPARHISRLVLSKKINTYADVECSSACTVIFIAGTMRVVTVGTKLGFHQTKYIGTPKVEGQDLEQATTEIFRNQGVPDSFIQKTYNTPNSKVWYPSYRELMDANVITHVQVMKNLIPITEYCRTENCD